MFLDSTFLIDFLRGKQKAISFLEERDVEPLFTSEINVFELVEGAYSGKEEISRHLEKISGLLNSMIVLPFDRRAALKAGEISGKLSLEGKKIGETDCLIAGVALAHGVTEIITENKEHFERVPGLKVKEY